MTKIKIMKTKEQNSKFDKVMTIILSILLISALTMVFTSCGTTRGGGCGGNPFQEGY